MSQNRLLLLGLLQVQERHGYELMDVVDKQMLTNLKKASAYYELNRMEAEGLIAARKEEQDGRPPRRIFTVTPAGEAAFREMLREALSRPDAQAASADMGLMFLDWLPRGEAAGLLQAKVSVMQQSLAACRTMPSHGAGSAVDLTTAHLVARLEFEIGWHQSLIERLTAGEEQA